MYWPCVTIVIANVALVCGHTNETEEFSPRTTGPVPWWISNMKTNTLIRALYSGHCGESSLEVISYWWIKGNLQYLQENMLGFDVVEIIMVSGVW